ncbi:LVIVD repeat-containing protein [Arthrospiribacter ruber]|uniref:LVIVD repeat-containing protein n=1 Tax=Arthrospiribacter ruber TaxID=2487934 RepID=A0A951IXR9_9BACT|nr:hypothetical protein [Arthrospiribacter ruber]MBW3468733.1 hypothetical protein [Arthrospiribacter ruber]
MKTSSPLQVKWPLFYALAAILFLTLPSCHDEVKSSHTFRAMVPVYLNMESVRSADILIESPKPLDNPGKIYIYEEYLLVNEPQKGIHILDNTDPSSPQPVNFINIPGNVDLAINSGYLYADSYVDLLVFDLHDVRNITLSERVKDVFEHMYMDMARSTILTFKDTVMTSETDMMWGWQGRPGTWMTIDRAMTASANSSASQSYGQGGSMARFTLQSGHLYAVDDYSLRVFDVIQAQEPKHLKNINLGWGIETIFPFQEKLFIGSQTGMHIYDASDPSNPQKMSVYEHITACDPVVVNEQHAFVTLRTGPMCRFGVDELHVLDIQNLYAPKLVKAYPMLNPHGLSLFENYLYLAEGKHGLKSFNVSDVRAIDANQIEFLKSMKSVDIIAGPKSLIVIGADGVCQFDYSNPAQLRKLSCIQVKQPAIV